MRAPPGSDDLLSGAIGEKKKVAGPAVAAIKAGALSARLPCPRYDLARLAPLSCSAPLKATRRDWPRERSEGRVGPIRRSRLAGFAAHLQDRHRDQERASIRAREIHDDTAARWAAAPSFDLARIQARPGCLATRIAVHLGRSTEMLQHALGASQRIMMNLRPALLEEGLVPALEWLVNSFERRTGISALLRATLARQDLAPDIGLVAYRTAQEARLTSPTKHAHCSRVRVELSDTGHALTLEVSDNGRGFSPRKARQRHSFSLEGLHERARSIGGWLDVSSREGGGTSITLTVPLSDLAPRTRLNDSG
jgi:signal transduction histidine kinase